MMKKLRKIYAEELNRHVIIYGTDDPFFCILCNLKTYDAFDKGSIMSIFAIITFFYGSPVICNFLDYFI